MINRQNHFEIEASDTILHHLVRQGADIQTIKFYCAQNYTATITNVSTPNAHLHLPIDLVTEANYPNEKVRQEVKNLLLGFLLLRNSTEPLIKEISLQSVDIFQAPKESLLHKIMLFAVKSINYARQYIIQSDTHPEANYLSPQEHEQLTNKINEMRTTAEELSASSTCLISYILKKNEFVKEQAIGNCEELSYLALEYFHNLFPIIPVEMYGIKNGDHCFLVIARNPHSDFDDYDNWGKHAVVCDPWAGKVFPASFLEKFLSDSFGYKMHGRIYNLTTGFNPEVHRLMHVMRLVSTHTEHYQVGRFEVTDIHYDAKPFFSKRKSLPNTSEPEAAPRHHF